MTLRRTDPLRRPPFGPFVLLDDGSGDLWWVDPEGDLLVWEPGLVPVCRHEVRTTTTRLSEALPNAVIERAFRDSRLRHRS